MGSKPIKITTDGVDKYYTPGPVGPDFQLDFIEVGVRNGVEYAYGDHLTTGGDIVIRNPADSGYNVIIASYLVNNISVSDIDVIIKTTPDAGGVSQNLINGFIGSTRAASFTIDKAAVGTLNGTVELTIPLAGSGNVRGGVAGTSPKIIPPGVDLCFSITGNCGFLINLVEQPLDGEV